MKTISKYWECKGIILELHSINQKGHYRALQIGTPEIKKDLTSLQSPDNQSGEYRNRTDDLLTASQTL